MIVGALSIMIGPRSMIIACSVGPVVYADTAHTHSLCQEALTFSSLVATPARLSHG